MKQIIGTLILSLAPFAVAFAQQDLEAEKMAKQGLNPAESSPQAALLEAYPELKNLNMTLSFGFEGEYLFRAKQYASQSFQPELKAHYNLGEGFGIYANVWDNCPLTSGAMEVNEMDLCAGIDYSYDVFRFSVGYGYYWFTNIDYPMTRVAEVNATAAMDTTRWLGDFNVTPMLIYCYGWNMDCSSIEARLFYSAPISKWVWGDTYLSIDTILLYGYTSANKYFGDQTAPAIKNGYGYAGVISDLVLTLTDYCKISVGIRYIQHNDGPQNDKGTEKHLFMGSKVSFSF